MFKKLALQIQQLFLGTDKLGNYLSGSWKDFTTNQPIFIIGSPRTGSTLLYQCMIERYKLCFVSNLMSALPRFMVTMTKFIPRVSINNGKKIKKESFYGYTPGLTSPSEAGAVFRFWFEKCTDSKVVYKTIESISKNNEAPFISKNLFNSTRIERIVAVFPEARFIYIKRNESKVVKSILKGNEVLSSGNISLGLDVDKSKPIEDQVLEEVRKINQIIQEKSKLISKSNWIEVDYEAFCLTPEYHIKKIGDIFALRSYKNYNFFQRFTSKK